MVRRIGTDIPLASSGPQPSLHPGLNPGGDRSSEMTLPMMRRSMATLPASALAGPKTLERRTLPTLVVIAFVGLLLVQLVLAV